jgi:hypothetical protein
MEHTTRLETKNGGVMATSSRRPPRPAAWIEQDLGGALAYQRRYQARPTAGDRWVQMMRDDNEREIERLTAELAEARRSASDCDGGGGDPDAA